MKPDLRGRVSGLRREFTNRFISDAYESWKQHGADTFEVLFNSHIETYAKLMAGLLPREMIFEPAMDAASVADLDAMIDMIKQHMLAKPGQPLLIEGDLIDVREEATNDASLGGGADKAAGPSGSAETAKTRRRKVQS